MPGGQQRGARLEFLRRLGDTSASGAAPARASRRRLPRPLQPPEEAAKSPRHRAVGRRRPRGRDPAVGHGACAGARRGRGARRPRASRCAFLAFRSAAAGRGAGGRTSLPASGCVARSTAARGRCACPGRHGVGRGRRRRLVLVAGGARAIDHHVLAVRLQREDLLLVLDEEALQQERRVHPWPIEVGDEHADLEVGGEDLGCHGLGILTDLR